MGRWDMDDVDSKPEMYEREIGERRHIVEECPIDIYGSSINPRWSYEYKLMSYWEARKSVAGSTDTIMIDSGFRKEGDMDEILEACRKVNADWFIPPDITPFFDEYDEITPEERAMDIWRYGRQWEQSDVDAKMLMPLHRPVGKHLDALETFQPPGSNRTMNLLKRYDGVAVGLKGIDVDERIEILIEINSRIPFDSHVHGLSPGTDMKMMAHLRENPHMIDSLDVSTPESAPANNKIPDNKWTQHRFRDDPERSWFPTGDDVSTLRALESARIMLQLNYMLSDLCDDSEFASVLERGRSDSPAPADD